MSRSESILFLQHVAEVLLKKTTLIVQQQGSIAWFILYTKLEINRKKKKIGVETQQVCIKKMRED